MPTPILDALKKYSDEHTIRLHMPGHKGTMGMDDVTEIPGTDNLYFPESCIKESLCFAKKYFGAVHTLYCVNGSTGALMALILGNVQENDTVLVDRACHKAVINSLLLAKAKIEFVLNSQRQGIAMPPSADDVIANASATGAKLIILTSPNYYGFCADIEKIAQWAKKNKVLLFVDEAHGFHFGASELLPKSAICLGADASASSCHKTALGLTQAAVCNIANESLVEPTTRCYGMLQTSSPSYLIMGSIEKSIDFLENEGESAYRRLYERRQEIKDKLESETGLEVVENDDFTRLVISTRDEKINAFELDRVLREKFAIQVEMADMHHLVGIMTPFDDFDIDTFISKLKAAIALCSKGKLDYIEIQYTKNKQILPMREALGAKSMRVKLKEANGRAAAAMLVPYPPGIPILFPGEEINSRNIEQIYDIINLGGIVNGVHGYDEIDVIREE